MSEIVLAKDINGCEDCPLYRDFALAGSQDQEGL